MLRWVLLALTILGFVLVFSTQSAWVLTLGLLLAAAGLFGFIVALAADRISANARPDTSMASTEDLIALNKRPRRAAAPAHRAPDPTPAARHTAEQGDASSS